MPVELAHDAGEISRLVQVITAYTLACCRLPEVSALSAIYRVRLQGHISF